MGNYKVRKATKSDEKELCALSTEVINNNFPVFMAIDIIKNFINSGMADKEITDNIEHNILVMEDEKEIIGLAVWKESLLHLLMVAPRCQGSGAAVYFLDYMGGIKLREFGEIYLECFKEN